MGSFEKLGILVIVIIIVMILVVAVYQWGGADFETAPEALRVAPYTPPVEIDRPHERDFDDLIEEERAPPISGAEREAEQEPAPKPVKTDRRGVPVQYIVRRNDSVWKLVRRWGLRDAFIECIRKENKLSHARLARLQVGQKLSIPDPRSYFRGAKYRTYVVREGDSYSTLAQSHLGSSRRWPEIKRLNPGIDPKRLRPGMKLKFPTK